MLGRHLVKLDSKQDGQPLPPTEGLGADATVDAETISQRLEFRPHAAVRRVAGESRARYEFRNALDRVEWRRLACKDATARRETHPRT